MMNKLKNILKTGILYKKLSLLQIVTFFSGVRYEILDIVDPSCFKVQIEKTPVVERVTNIDTQDIPDSYELKPPPKEEGNWTKSLLPLGQKEKKSKLSGGARNRNSSIRRTRKRSNNGGKTRKSKYSRKHRSHRKGGSTRQRKRR